jgi:hypothetical protein
MALRTKQLSDRDRVRRDLPDAAQVLLDLALEMGCTARLRGDRSDDNGTRLAELVVYGTPVLPCALVPVLWAARFRLAPADSYGASDPTRDTARRHYALRARAPTGA